MYTYHTPTLAEGLILIPLEFIAFLAITYIIARGLGWIFSHSWDDVKKKKK